MRNLSLLTVAAALAFGCAFSVVGVGSADAAEFQAYSISGGPIAGNQSFTGALGNDFDVSSPITITSLGVFDDNADGISGSIDVHIFDLNDTSTPLATATIMGAGDPLMGQFRFMGITPLILGPGSYSVVAFGFDGTDRNGNENVFDIPLVTDDGSGLISFIDSRFGSGGVDPTTTFPAITTVGSFPCSGQPEACFAAGSFEYAAVPVIEKKITSGPCVSDPGANCEGDLVASTGDFVGSDGTNEVVVGVVGGGCAWTIDDAQASISTDGDLSVSWQGLLIDGAVTSPPAVANCAAINDTTFNLDWFVSVACNGAVVESTGLVAPKPDNLVGDGGIDVLGFFTPAEFQACIDPTVLIVAEQGSNDQWAAYAPLSEDIAVAVLAPATSSIHYDFKITVDTTDLTDPVVYDTVPAEWTVTHIDGEKVGPDDNHYKFDENLPDWPVYGDEVGVGCGGFQVELGDADNVTVSRGGSYKKNKCSSSTHLVWEMVPNEMDMIRVDLQSRGPKKNGKFKPTFCGALYLNNGAVLMDGSTVVGETGPLVVASMFDLDGGGIDPTGQGDEDHDGATDIDEVRVLGTDPCDDDTDDDGILDGADLCPIEGLPPTGYETDADGCNVLLPQ